MNIVFCRLNELNRDFGATNHISHLQANKAYRVTVHVMRSYHSIPGKKKQIHNYIIYCLYLKCFIHIIEGWYVNLVWRWHWCLSI